MHLQLPKVILPPALSLLLFIAVIYGMGSCMAVLPQPYRVRGPWVVETVPEREVVVETASDAPVTISLFSWGASFSRDGSEFGTLKYERVYYVLRDAYGVPVWKMTCHDTYVAVADPRGNELFRIVNRTDGIDIVDARGALIAYIAVSGDRASLTAPDGSILAETTLNGSGRELRSPEGVVVRVSDRSISPAGLIAATLPSFDPLEHAALMIMVK
jgi:hypothetical protein